MKIRHSELLNLKFTISFHLLPKQLQSFYLDPVFSCVGLCYKLCCS